MTDGGQPLMTRLGAAFFDGRVRAARSAERGRVHYNLHPRLEDPVQRMCVAMEPGSYFRPHRHAAGGRWELFIALRGGAAVLIFDDSGRVLDRAELSCGGETVLVEIPPGAWHTLVVLHPGTVLFESKPGPYSPLSDKDFAAWAPEEGSPFAPRFEDWFRSAATGDPPPDLP